jgi:MFS family permease
MTKTNQLGPERPPAWIMIVTGMLVTLTAVALSRLAYGLILPFMRAGLGISYQQAGNLGTASALGYLCFVMLAGVLAARRGGRATVLLGTSLTTIGFLGLSVAEHYSLLLVLMLMLGFGTAFAFTPVISLLASWFPARRGAVIGITNSGIGLGMVCAGALVPYLNSAYGSIGWRMTWGVFAAVSATATIAVFMFLRNPPTLAAAPTHVQIPLDKGSVYKNRHVITVGLLYGVVGLTYIAQAIFMYSFALESGVAPLTAGRLAAMMGILSIFASPGWGWLSDRFGRASVLTTAVSLTLIGTLIPVIWPVLPGFVLHFLILGCTVSGMFTSILAASSESVQPHQAPLAVSFVTLFYAAGQFIGPAIAGLIIEHAGGFRPAFATNCLIMTAGVYLSWQLRKLGKHNHPD